jgi:hypothetical protein
MTATSDIPTTAAAQHALRVLCAAVVGVAAAGASHARAQTPPSPQTPAMAPAANTCVARSGAPLAQSWQYVFSYQGGCDNGLAQGEGRAQWLPRSEGRAPIVWEGRFDRGIFLGLPAVRAARPLADGQVLLDLGPLADSEGKGGRLWVQAALDGNTPADACAPMALHVLVDIHSSLGSEQVARQWMQAALQHWQRACPAAVQNLVRLMLYQGFELAADGDGRLPAPVVRATASLQGRELLFQQYSNNAAAQQQHNAGLPEQRREYSANAQRLQTMVRQYQAQRVVDLPTLDKNLGALRGQVVLVGVRPERILSRRLATVRTAHREGWDSTAAVVEGQEIARWGKDSRMLAVKVIERSTDVRTQEQAILQLLGSARCSEVDCEDYLLMPGGQWAHNKALP